MGKTHKIIGSLAILFVASGLAQAGSFHMASKPSCDEVEFVVKGKISYKDTMKSGDLGFHHCIHRRPRSEDFPRINPQNTQCRQVDVEPEVIAINPPLPHDVNASLPLFNRPNPYHIPDGSTCEVKYVQYYFRP